MNINNMKKYVKWARENIDPMSLDMSLFSNGQKAGEMAMVKQCIRSLAGLMY